MTTFPKLRGPVSYKGLTIDEGSYINSDSIIIPADGHTVHIGRDCAIGHWCYLSTRMHKTENHKEWFSGDIVIEDNCWLGNSVVVYPNVTIGHDCVVGHATTVVRDMQPYTLLKNMAVVEARRL